MLIRELRNSYFVYTMPETDFLNYKLQAPIYKKIQIITSNYNENSEVSL